MEREQNKKKFGKRGVQPSREASWLRGTKKRKRVHSIYFCLANPRVLSVPRMPLRPKFPGIYALSSNDIKVGTNIEVDGAPWRVLEFLHVKPGKGAAFVRTKMRNYVTGNTVEKTFRAGSTIDEADVFKETKQFTYKDGSQFVFMDLTTYEETRLGELEVGDKTKWLKEGMDCNLLFWNGKVIDFELPITVQLTVVDVDPGLRGDTAQDRWIRLNRIHYSGKKLTLGFDTWAPQDHAAYFIFMTDSARFYDLFSHYVPSESEMLWQEGQSQQLLTLARWLMFHYLLI